MPDKKANCDDQSARIADLEKRVKFPRNIAETVVSQWEENREYVRTVAQLQETSDTSTTNYILRALQTAVEASSLNSPVVNFKPGGYLPAQSHPDPAIQQEALADGNPFNRYPVGWSTYTKTQEILLTKQAEAGGLYEALEDMNRERRYCSVAWLKVRWIEDDNSDPLGAPLPTEQARKRRYLALHEAWENGDIEEDDDTYHEMHRISEALKQERLDELSDSLAAFAPEPPTDMLGQPLPGALDPRQEEYDSLSGEGLFPVEQVLLAPAYQGYSFEVVDSEDIRFDWTVKRPGDFRRMRGIAHRTPMLPSDIVETWGAEWADDEHGDYLGKYATGGENEATAHESKVLDSNDLESEVHNTDLEAQAVGKRPYVWEYWDLVTRERYRWVAGARKFLDVIPLRDVPSRLHPFFPLLANPISGRIFGPTDVELGKSAQDRINMLTTHDLQARKSAYPIWAVQKGILSPEDKQSLRDANPYEVIETTRPAEEIQKAIAKIAGGDYNPALYRTNEAVSALEVQMGIAASRMGTTSQSDLATTEAIANQGFGDRTQASIKEQTRLLRDVFTYMAQMNARRMSEENVRTIVGPGAYWPVEQMEHDQILSNYMVRVKVAPNEAQEKQQQLSRLQILAGIAQQAGLPLNRIWMLDQAADALGASEEREEMLDLALLLAPPAAPAPGEQGSQPEDEDPEEQGERGREGGRPDMQEQEPPITPESIPNNQAPEQ